MTSSNIKVVFFSSVPLKKVQFVWNMGMLNFISFHVFDNSASVQTNLSLAIVITTVEITNIHSPLY